MNASIYRFELLASCFNPLAQFVLEKNDFEFCEYLFHFLSDQLISMSTSRRLPTVTNSFDSYLQFKANAFREFDTQSFWEKNNNFSVSKLLMAQLFKRNFLF